MHGPSWPRPAAPATYYDVAVAHPCSTGVPTGQSGELLKAGTDPDVAIERATKQKRAKYAPPDGIPQVLLVPIIFDTADSAQR